MSSGSVAIIGAGFTGLAAAYDLARAGRKVVIFESEDEIGGLAGTFAWGSGARIEKFYHHWFTSDAAIRDFIDELGLGGRVRVLSSRTGLYFANSLFRLSSPWGLLTFSPLPLLDRIRTGLLVLRARRVADWRALESLSAAEWLVKSGGKRGYEVIWKPLMNGKFGAEAPHVSAVWIWNKLKLRGSSRDSSGGESLLYFDGGFGALLSSLRAELERLGVEIRLRTPVERISVDDGRACGVRSGGREHAADHVLSTCALPAFLDLTEGLPPEYVRRCREIRFLGNCCLVMMLDRSLSSTYWLNVADPAFPFVGIIEHTNFIPKENYDNAHVVYLSKYLPASDPLYSLGTEAYFEYCLPFIRKIFPEFSAGWVLSKQLWKAPYSQPVITQGYSRMIPESRTPIRNLWLSTMAQIYPEDRGTNYAVRAGREVAGEIIRSGYR